MFFVCPQPFLVYHMAMVYFARHGETDANKQGMFNGRGVDQDLNKLGIEQAKKQAEQLAGIKFDAVYCSPQKRAIQTCEILVSGGKYQIDERIAELICGDFDGKKKNLFRKIKFVRSAKKGKNGVELFKTFVGRNVDFCEDVLKSQAGKNILIVSHNGNAVAFDYYFKGKPKGYKFARTIIENGEVLTFDY